MTIELIGFREHGLVAFSKSKGYGLRLWDLNPSQPTKENKAALVIAAPSSGGGEGSGGRESPAPMKIVHRDVANSADVQSVAGGFAFGGEYGLSVIKLRTASDALTTTTATKTTEGSSSLLSTVAGAFAGLNPIRAI